MEIQFVEYGSKVESLSEMREVCSPIDCLARMIMGEAEGEPRLGKVGVAYVVKNRQTIGKKSEFGGPDYKSIVLQGEGSQFNGIRSPKALNPKAYNLSAWNECLDVASNFIFESDPIGKCLWFNTTKLYNSILAANGGKYKFASGLPLKVVESKVIGNHTFFRVEGYNF